MVAVAERVDSPGAPGVVLVPGDARRPLSHCFGWHLLWMNPSGVASAGVHPHGVVTSLEWLNAPTEEHLQQIHTGDTMEWSVELLSRPTCPSPASPRRSLSTKMEFEHDQKRKGEVQSTDLGSRYPGSRTRSTASP